MHYCVVLILFNFLSVSQLIFSAGDKLKKLYPLYVKLGDGTDFATGGIMPLGEVYFDATRSRKFLYGAHVKHLITAARRAARPALPIVRSNSARRCRLMPHHMPFFNSRKACSAFSMRWWASGISCRLRAATEQKNLPTRKVRRTRVVLDLGRNAMKSKEAAGPRRPMIKRRRRPKYKSRF